MLGFFNTMSKIVMEIELKMKLETILSGFMVGKPAYRIYTSNETNEKRTERIMIITS